MVSIINNERTDWHLAPATEAKIISMFAIGLGSFIVGVTPACFITRAKELHETLLLSCTLCFGGGVLFATSVLHMLPEVRQTLPRHAELVFCCGFLLLYMVDELVHYICSNEDKPNLERQSHETKKSVASITGLGRTITDGNGRISGPNVRSLWSQNGTRSTPDLSQRSKSFGNILNSSAYRKTSYGSMQLYNNHEDEATFVCHGSHMEPCPDSNTGTFGLLIALTAHSILEGLSIGLQKKTAEVILLVVAVASHKFVVGFCLGLELAGAGSSILKLFAAIFVFATGSSLGIGIGLLSFHMTHSWSVWILPILQGLAGGTLLYVTVSEVLPRERSRWHKSIQRAAGILQCFAVIIGFTVIFLIDKYVGE